MFITLGKLEARLSHRLSAFDGVGLLVCFVNWLYVCQLSSTLLRLHGKNGMLRAVSVTWRMLHCEQFRVHPFSERELTFTFASLYAVARPSVDRLSVCLSVTFVRPNCRLKFLAIFLRHSVPWLSVDIQEKCYGDRHRSSGTPPSGALNARGVAKYSDFGPTEGYISETVQDRRWAGNLKGREQRRLSLRNW